MHHNDSPDLDARTDICDLYVFQKPGDAGKTILILDVNPEAPSRAERFDPAASYELKIDTDGDFEPEIAFHVLFMEEEDGQSASVYRASDEDARCAGACGEALIQQAPVSFTGEAHITSAGEYRFFAGLRSEPFFADPGGFINNMQWTGVDYWGDKDVFAVVLEVPNDALGSNPRVGVWGRTMVPVQGVLTPVNQMGRPGNNVLKGSAALNSTPPARQRQLFLEQYISQFRGFGYPEEEATRLAGEWLPDILPYDYSDASGYPNGRQLRDDIIDNLVAILTRGKMSSDLLGPHSDYLAEFPYLGVPHSL